MHSALTPRHFRFRSTTNFAVWYILPLTLITIMYTRISLVLWRTSRLDSSRCTGASASSQAAQARQRPKGRPLRQVALYQRFSGPSSGRLNTTETASSEDTEDEQVREPGALG